MYMKMYSAWIITIGNELLIGKIINTNASWLARRLTLLGYNVNRIIVIPDNLNDIAETFREAVNKNIDIVISTGGLGPTFDDKTSEGLALAFNKKLVINEDALKMVREKYVRKGWKLTKSRIKMAKLPENAIPIRNHTGTAPGIFLKVNDTYIISLPGVPVEMKIMFDFEVINILKERASKYYYSEAELTCKGLPESGIAPIVKDIMDRFKNVYIKSHPRCSELGQLIITIHVTSFGKSRSEADKNVSKAVAELKELLEKLGGKIS